ncbi:uncharacterized protein DUF2785 [Streptomyces sp. TLI_235]|nr:DUF2785 domain-containing protein [Streptomyces sp. TLI_235]PBC70724.1 uncharacterized protein DUF2785 [Streptomyces sp. TLI_235]
MTRWRPFLDDDTLRPEPELVAALSADLRSPDPAVRDEQAYVLLNRWIPRLLPEIRHRLGDEMAERFTDPAIQARTFAPLILARLVRLGDHDPAWQRAFATWYRTETDLRGHDPELGWLHAAAHGADLLGAYGRSPHTEPAELLELASDRLLAPTDHVFDAMEDDRLGLAVALTLTRPELTERQSVDWLTPITADFAAGRPGPVPAHASNTVRTLRVLYLLADRGVRPAPDAAPVRLTHAHAVREAVAEVLATACPCAG